MLSFLLQSLHVRHAQIGSADQRAHGSHRCSDGCMLRANGQRIRFRQRRFVVTNLERFSLLLSGLPEGNVFCS